MKTQTPSEKFNWRRAGLLALATGGLLMLTSCHHGVYGQPRRPHPHMVVNHSHAPDAFASDYYGRSAGSGKAVVGGGDPYVAARNAHDPNYWAHCHTTRAALFRQPNIRHTLGH